MASPKQPQMHSLEQPQMHSLEQSREHSSKQSREHSRKPRQFLKILTLPIWVCVAFIACEYIITFGLYFLVGRDWIFSTVGITVVNALVYAAALFVIIFIPLKLFHQKFSLQELGLSGLPTWSDIGFSLVGFLAYLILASVLVSLFSLFPFFNANEAQELGYSFLTSGFDRLIAFFALAIVAPICEEIVFRGWLYAKLRKKISGKKSIFLSIFITSLTFALLHGQWNVGVNVFVMSLVLCFLRELTGSIHSGILLHVIKNTVAFILVFILA